MTVLPTRALFCAFTTDLLDLSQLGTGWNVDSVTKWNEPPVEIHSRPAAYGECPGPRPAGAMWGSLEKILVQRCASGPDGPMHEDGSTTVQ